MSVPLYFRCHLYTRPFYGSEFPTKGNGLTVICHASSEGGVEIQPYSFLTSALEVSGQSHAPAALLPGEIAGTHSTAGWVGPRVGMDECEKEICFFHRN